MKVNLSHPHSHLYCFLGILFWSTLELAGKFLGPEVSPYAITAWRFLIGGLVLLPFALIQPRPRNRRPRLADLALMAFLGVLIVCLSMLLLQLSILYGKASLSAVLVSSNPLFVSVFAFFLLREKLNLTQILGLFAGLAGIALLIAGEGELGSSRYLNLPLSIALALAAALVFGLYAVLTKRSVARHGNILTNSVSFLGGAVLLFIFNALTGQPLLLDLDWKTALIMLYLGVIVSGVAYVYFFEGMKKLGANTASLYFFLKPVIASLLAVLILRERLSLLQVLAILVIIFGLTVSRVMKRA
ncbi:MAG: DMT family transporter [Candidatus Syntrophosphaera sp.]|nr:DMT family transporter [Candidatus Syntrophosphaera sp.]